MTPVSASKSRIGMGHMLARRDDGRSSRLFGAVRVADPSERLEEGEQRESVEPAQLLELPPRRAGLSAVVKDGLLDGCGAAVVQEEHLGAHAPERLCPHQPA